MDVFIRVAINNISVSIDKLYDYKLRYDDNADDLIGRRVIVPFGAANKTHEAFIFEVLKQSSVPRIKYIKQLQDEQKFLTKEMVKLAIWMKERYICSYVDAIKLMIPSGISIQTETWVELIQKDSDVLKKACGKSIIRKCVTDELLEKAGPLTIDYLSTTTTASISEAIKYLASLDIIRIYEVDSSKVKDKLVRFVKLNVEICDAQGVIENMGQKSNVQKRILSELCAQGEMSAADLVNLAHGSYNALSSLREKSLIVYEDIIVSRDPLFHKDIQMCAKGDLNHEQQVAADRIISAMNTQTPEVFLLHGVTGSGKTEVFMTAIDHALEKKQTALVLVSEISLTSQLTDRFLKRFGKRVAILHSKLSLGERYDEWKKIKAGEADVIIGARSAVFAPCANIGIIILDEEHETSYKSETVPRYLTKEIAFFRAKFNFASVVLSSATPSMESYYNAKRGIYKLLSLKERYSGYKMPRVDICDMSAELKNGNNSVFSRTLKEEIEKNLELGEQTILFLNRRGFSSFVSCRSCGYVAKCPNCSISLTYHKFRDNLVCHYCGYTIPSYMTCPECYSKYIKHFGIGTQRIEEEAKRSFPTAKVIRMDVDTTGKKNAHEHILNKFENERVDILIGTQMVAKGLDFENVTLVGVIAADIGLNIDDFRASERSFCVLTQVSGRAGRGKKEGRAIIQTYAPDTPAITFAANHDYEGFFDDEITMRKNLLYPPFCRIVKITVSAVSQMAAQACIHSIAKTIKKKAEEFLVDKEILQLLGPSASGVFKINNKYRFNLIIKCKSAEKLTPLLTHIRDEHLKSKDNRYVSLSIDKNTN